MNAGAMVDGCGCGDEDGGVGKGGKKGARSKVAELKEKSSEQVWDI